MYIKRNANQQITSISHEAQEGFVEASDADMLDLEAFLKQVNSNFIDYELKDIATLKEAQEYLSKSDEELVRVIEDVIQVLTHKGILQFTDLPSHAQRKLLSRQSARSQANRLMVLEEEENEIYLP